MWATVKRAYNRLPPRARFLVLYPSFLRLWGPTMVRDFVRGAPFWTCRKYDRPRGMSPWNDVVDWVGGIPLRGSEARRSFRVLPAAGLFAREAQDVWRGTRL